MRYKRVLLLLIAVLAATTVRAQYLHKPGEKAVDFEGTTVDGQTYRLFDSQAERILVCFWSVDCDECHAFLRKLRRRTDLKHDYELVTFALAETPEEIRREVKKLRLPGWHFFDEAGWDSAPFMDYDVNITPTVVLIDKDKNVVGEAYDWDEFKELIQIYEK